MTVTIREQNAESSFGSSPVHAQVFEQQPSYPWLMQQATHREVRSALTPCFNTHFNFLLCFFIKCLPCSLGSLRTENQTELLVWCHFHSCILGVPILCVVKHLNINSMSFSDPQGNFQLPVH